MRCYVGSDDPCSSRSRGVPCEPIEMPKKLRCYLGFHRWQRVKQGRVKGPGESGWYKECRDCGKFGEIPPPPPPGADAGGPAGGMI